MASDSSLPYRLTPAARADVAAILSYTAETWSYALADRYADELSQVFDMIARMPSLGRAASGFNPPVRIHVHRSHLIIYRIADDHVAILRLLGGRQNWLTILRASDL